MLVGMVLFWAAVGVGLYLLFRVLASRGGALTPPPLPVTEPPRAALDRRLAAGEITPDEYDRLRRRLEGG